MSAANVITAIAVVNDILALIVNANSALAAVSATIQKAQNEGRDLTDAELDTIRDRRKAVVVDLKAEIARRQQQP